MSLRDHFHPPLDHKHSWDELHGPWPAMIVLQLSDILPEGYVAAPSVHLGGAFEIDVSTYEQHDSSAPGPTVRAGGVVIEPWAPPAPTFTHETDLPEQDEYEVRVYDA